MKRRGSRKGSVYRRKDAATWYISYYDRRGRKRQESTGTTDQDEAAEILRKRIVAIDEGRPIRANSKLTLAQLYDDLVTDYEVNERKSLSKVKRDRRPVEDFFGPEMRVVEITGADLKEYVRARKKAGKANATIRNELAWLRRAFNLKVEEEVLTKAQVPPFPKITVKNARKTFWQTGDFRAFINAFDSKVERTIALVAYWSGWRINNVLTLKWEWVDFVHQVIEIPETKNSEGYLFAFEELKEVEDALRELRRSATSEWVFPSIRDDSKPYSYWTLRTRWDKALEAAKVPRRLRHDLRRTFARENIMAGNDRKTVMDSAGWKTSAMLDRYDIVEKGRKAQAVARRRRYLTEVLTEVGGPEEDGPTEKP
jgi:integrase